MHFLTATYGATTSALLSILFDVGGIVGAIAAGVISDYSGMSALTCVAMFGLAFPTVSTKFNTKKFKQKNKNINCGMY